MISSAALCGAAVADPALPPAVSAALARAGVPPQALAATAWPLNHWNLKWGHQADLPMQPGSAMKLVTSIVALERLGPNHRGFTLLRSAAAVDAGVLRGELVLQGGADPELSVAHFWQLLMELREQGVHTIAGDLVVDRTRFRPARMDLGLPPFDEAPEFPYNVIPDALMLAGNLLSLELRSGPEGVSVRSVPALPGVELSSQMALTDTACNQWGRDWRSARVSPGPTEVHIELQGAFPRACTQRVELQLFDRQRLAESLFRALWTGLGGQWQGRAVEGAAPADARVLVRRDSRPWGEVLRGMNKRSDNAITRLLFLELGQAAMAAQPHASTAELAGQAVRQWLQQHGISDAGLVLDNGSGLSRSERIAPAQLAAMLERAFHAPYASDLMMSLPLAGVDGTLRNRLKDSPAAGWARLKTGTLANVVALAGYLSDDAGRPWAVAMMINHANAAAARPALDALVTAWTSEGPWANQHQRQGIQADGP